MTPRDFLRTIYLGDRGCRGIYLNSSQRRVEIIVDAISRVRDPSGVWNFYSDEDIENGRLVFVDATSYSSTPPGLIPNDFMNDIEVEEFVDSRGNTRFRFRLSIGWVSDVPVSYQECIIHIEAGGLHLEDPAKPGVEIKT